MTINGITLGKQGDIVKLNLVAINQVTVVLDAVRRTTTNKTDRNRLIAALRGLFLTHVSNIGVCQGGVCERQRTHQAS